MDLDLEQVRAAFWPALPAGSLVVKELVHEWVVFEKSLEPIYGG